MNENKTDILKEIDEAVEGLMYAKRDGLFTNFKSEKSIEKAIRLLRALKGVLKDE